MKCPVCGHMQPVRDGMVCAKCQYQFTFNPKLNEGLADGKFLATIRSASQNDTAYFTENQLYASFVRRNQPQTWQGLGCAAAAFAGTVLMAGVRFWPIAFFALAVCLLILVGTLIGSLRRIPPEKFQQYLRLWFSDGKTIDRMLDKPRLHEPPPDWNEPDIYDYGVERVLIVERDILVDLFVLNGVHAEQRMLVMSESGYPKYLLPLAKKLITDQPNLPVFLLHDATRHGVSMSNRLHSSQPFGDILHKERVTDLGMFPNDFAAMARTRYIDSKNTDRELPVDCIAMPMLVAGLATAMEENITLAEMIERQHRDGSGGDGGGDFG